MSEVIKNEQQADLKNTVNIRQFTLAPSVKENGAEVKAIREYVKTKDISLIQKHLDSGKIIEISEDHNIIVTAGLTQLAMGLTGERATAPIINYGVLGTGTPNPVAGQTQLVAEAFRKLASSKSHSNNTVYVDFFFAAADCNGTYTEFGNVIDGAAGANTGTLFSSIATGGWVKSSAQSLFISCQYNINNA